MILLAYTTISNQEDPENLSKGIIWYISAA